MVPAWLDQWQLREAIPLSAVLPVPPPVPAVITIIGAVLSDLFWSVAPPEARFVITAADGVTRLSQCVVAYDPETETLELKVQVPANGSTANELFIYYGNRPCIREVNGFTPLDLFTPGQDYGQFWAPCAEYMHRYPDGAADPAPGEPLQWIDGAADTDLPLIPAYPDESMEDDFRYFDDSAPGAVAQRPNATPSVDLGQNAPQLYWTRSLFNWSGATIQDDFTSALLFQNTAEETFGDDPRVIVSAENTVGSLVRFHAQIDPLAQLTVRSGTAEATFALPGAMTDSYCLVMTVANLELTAYAVNVDTGQQTSGSDMLSAQGYHPRNWNTYAARWDAFQFPFSIQPDFFIGHLGAIVELPRAVSAAEQASLIDWMVDFWTTGLEDPALCTAPDDGLWQVIGQIPGNVVLSLNPMITEVNAELAAQLAVSLGLPPMDLRVMLGAGQLASGRITVHYPSTRNVSPRRAAVRKSYDG